MNRKIAQILVAAIFIFMCAACRRDSGIMMNPGEEIDTETVTGSVSGMVVNEHSAPVAGAMVQAGGQTTITNQYGYFQFSGITLSKANATVKVVQAGYFTGFRTFRATAGMGHHIRVQLIPKTNIGSFSASTGGIVTMAGGARVEIPAGAITTTTGIAYTGTVQVAMAWINPTSPDMPATIPGSLRGITAAGAERGLETYGMIGVELTNGSGQPLKLAAGKKARLEFPLPAAIQAAAPATIALWHFDEATARWKEEGAAVKNGNFYEAQVSHFSFWNCDAPFDVVTVCMNLVNSSNNQPLSYTQVRIRRLTPGPGSTAGTGFTDSLGNLCAVVPANEILVLEVLNPCGTPVYTQSIGPFAANASIGTVTVNIPASTQFTVTGQVTGCSGAPLASGIVYLYQATGLYKTGVVTNGSFSIPVINCSGTAFSFTVVALDYTTLAQSNPVGSSGTSGTVNVGAIQVCGPPPPEFMRTAVDSTVHLLIPPADSVYMRSFANVITISGKKLPGNIYSSSMSFSYTAPVPGSYPISSVTIGLPFVTTTYPNPGAQVHITEFGPPGAGFIAGNYTVQVPILFTVQTFATQFRVRRPL